MNSIFCCYFCFVAFFYVPCTIYSATY